MSDHGTAQHAASGHEEHSTHHVIPTSIYYRNFTALMVLLVLTLVAAMFNLGSYNIFIAVTIAVIKAVLIILYFMHLRWSSQLIRIFAGAAFVWLGILFFMTLGDYVSRTWSWLPGR